MTLMQDFRSAIDGARYVETHDERDLIAVWHGGHTINFYAVTDRVDDKALSPTTCINVGDFAEDSATLEEVKEGIEREFSQVE